MKLKFDTKNYNSFFKSNVFIKSLFFSVAVVIIPVLIISFLSFSISKKQILDQNLKVYEIMMKENIVQFNRPMESFDTLTKAFISNDVLWNLVSSSQVTNRELLFMRTCIDMLRDIKDADSLFNSVYFFNNKLDYVLDSNTKYKKNDFYNSEILKQAYSLKKNTLVYNVFNKSPVLTYYRVFHFYHRKETFYLVVNIDCKKLLDSIMSYSENSMSYILFNSKNLPVYYSGELLNEENIKEITQNTDILYSGKSTGEYENYLISLGFSDHNSFILALVQDKRTLLSSIIYFRKVLLFIVLSILLIFILVSIFYVFRSYYPLHTLLKRMGSNNNIQNKFNDYDMINQNITSLLSINQDLNLTVETLYPDFQISPLKYVINNNEINEKKFSEILRILDKKFIHQGFTIVVLTFRNIVVDKTVFKEVQTYFSHFNGNQLLFSKEDNSQLVILVNLNNRSEQVEIAAYSVMKKFNVTNKKCSIFISDFFNGVKLIPSKYRLTIKNARFLAFDFNDEIILENEIWDGTFDIVNNSDIELSVNTIKTLLFEKKIEQYNETVIGIIDQSFKDYNSDEYLKYNLYYILLRVNNILSEYNFQCENFTNSKNLYESFTKTTSIVELKELLFNFGKDAIILIERIKNDYKSNIVQNTVAFIKEYYMTDISIESLSSKNFTSPSYLSHIFKDQKGDSIYNYIQKYRVKKGKELLNKTNFKIKDIAEMVGFHGVQSFIRAFKKQMNLTPDEYRKTLINIISTPLS